MQNLNGTNRKWFIYVNDDDDDGMSGGNEHSINYWVL